MRRPEEKLRPVDVGLNAEEVQLMVEGFAHWFGPAHPEPESAQLAGFSTAEDMADGVARLRDALRAGAAITRRDWKRALIATELIFASDAFGAGVEWEIVTGRDEVQDLGILREIQRKLVGVCPRPASS
jgi:hypothetical protein